MFAVDVIVEMAFPALHSSYHFVDAESDIASTKNLAGEVGVKSDSTTRI